MAKEFTYEVKKKLGSLDSDSKMVKELRVISWGGAKEKYDLRGWQTNEDGTEKMTKGVSLDEEELRSLYEILKEMYESEE